jgi:hypothetical protein
MVRDAIALLRDVSADSFDVVIEAHLDRAADEAVAAVAAANERAQRAAEEASVLQRRAAQTLVEEYRLTVRDAGRLLHLSPQRISQLTGRRTTPTDARHGMVTPRKPRKSA